MSNWRSSAVAFTDVGRSLETITNGIRTINATAAVNDETIKNVVLPEMRKAAARLVRAIERLQVVDFDETPS